MSAAPGYENRGHTPAPWRINASTPSLIDDANGNKVAQASPVHGGVNHVKETRANARLIAAAPELLDALHELCASVERIQSTTNTHGEGTAVAIAKAAIAKAEGRS